MRYRVEVDWNSDGVFDAPGESLTRDVLRVEWALGLEEPEACMAAPSWAVVTLRDPARHYAPERAAGPLYGQLEPRRKVRISGEHGGETRVYFTGWVEEIAPGPGRTAVLRCGGVEALLARAEVFLPLLTAGRADTVAAAILARVAYPPAISGYWLLGTACLGRDTRLPDVTTYAELERGISAFAYVGDRAGVSAWTALREVAEAERGLCFVDRGGRVILWNRHHLPCRRDPRLALTGREARFTAAVSGADIVNRAVITCHPREVGGSPEELWELRAPLVLPPGEARTVRARFVDGAGLPCGALSVLAPVPGVDYRASDRPDGSGADCTGNVAVSVKAGGSSAALTFRNGGARQACVLAGARLRGIRLIDRGPTAVEHADALSVTRYGRRTIGLDLPLLSSPAEAARLARHLVVERRDPRGRVREVTLELAASSALLPAALALTIGDCIRLADPETGHDGVYFIVGERHTLARGGAKHTIAWTVRAAPPLLYWQLGVPGAGEVGAATTLGY